MSRRPGARNRFRPTTEALEGRALLSVTMQIDYSRDTLGFFADPARRAILQTAADTLGTRLTDTLPAIVPQGTNTWTAITDDPSTGLPFNLVNPSIPANTLRIFAGGRALGGSELGRGGFGATEVAGDDAWLDLVSARGQSGALTTTETDFGPWGGTITFNSNASWYFNKDATGLKSNQNDFLSVAIHELEHLLGFGTASSWSAKVFGNSFVGQASMAAYDVPGSPVPVSADGGHWRLNTFDGGIETTMTPVITQGERKLATRLDFAGLQDVGWTLSSDLDGTLGGAIDTGLAGAGVVSLPGLSLGPDKTDVDLFRINANAGQVLSVATGGRAGGVLADTFLRVFDFAGNELTRSSNRFTYDNLTFTALATGTYYVGVSASGNGVYSVREDLAQRLAGQVGDYDITFRLDAAAGGTVSDLSVLVTAPPSVQRGESLTYTATIANNGPDAAGSARLTETLPSSVTVVSVIASQGTVSVSGGVLTANFGTLAAGSTATVQITVTPIAAGNVVFTLRASATQVDPQPGDNEASASTTVIAPPDSDPPIVFGFRLKTTGRGAKKITTIVVSFSEDIDPARAADIGAYSLSKAGPIRKRRATPRVPLGIRSAVFDPFLRTISIVPLFKGALPKGLRLVIASNPPQGLRDREGNALDGNRDGIAGGDAVIQITR